MYGHEGRLRTTTSAPGHSDADFGHDRLLSAEQADLASSLVAQRTHTSVLAKTLSPRRCPPYMSLVGEVIGR